MGSLCALQTRRALGGVIGKGREFPCLQNLGGSPRIGKCGGSMIDELRQAGISLIEDGGDAHASPAIRSKVSRPALTVRAGSKALRM